jgi:hypothetical protein
MMIDVVGVRPLGGFKLEIEFSDGTTGVRDFGFVAEKKPGRWRSRSETMRILPASSSRMAR